MAKTKLSMQQAEGETSLILNCESDSTQLLVKLCRNSKSWLSPVGWSDQEKGTLLDCATKTGKTEVQIPEEFCVQLENGDKLKLSCDDLNFAEEIIWNTSLLPENSQTSPAPVETEKKKSFFSRFAKTEDGAAAPTIAAEPVESHLSPEAARRAEEAERAAADYRMKMEAAEAARADAKHHAEVAAKAAQEAAKAEAERIAEMDRAEKEFKKAEKLRLEEQRRLEEEIRAEEARRAEIARIAEEKRKKEEAARIAAEQQAQRERLQTKIEAHKKEKEALAAELKSLKQTRNELEANVRVDDAEISKISAKAASAEGLTDSDRQAYEVKSKSLLSLDDQISNLNLAADETEKARSKLAKRLSQTEAAFNKAKAEAETAKLRADEKKAIFDSVTQEDQEFLTRLSEIAEKKAGIEKSRDSLRRKVDKLRAQLDISKQQFAAETEALTRMSQAQETRKSDLADMQLKIDRLGKSLNEMDGDISTLTLKYAKIGQSNNQAASPAAVVTVTETTIEKKEDTFGVASHEDAGGRFNHRKKNSAKPSVIPLKSAAAELAEETAQDSDPAGEVADAEIEADESLRKRGNSSTLLGLAIGGVVAASAIYALSQPGKTNTQTAKATPVSDIAVSEAPVLVASMDNVMPEAINSETVTAAVQDVMASPAQDSMAPETPEIPIRLASLQEPAQGMGQGLVMESQSYLITFDPLAYAARGVQDASLRFDVPQSISRPEAGSFAKTEESLPETTDMDIEKTATATAVTPKPKAKVNTKAKIKAPQARPAKVQTAKRETAVATKPAATASEPKAEIARTVNPAAIRQVQDDLGVLGLYSGALTADPDEATLSAMHSFKRQHGLPVDDSFTPELLNQLTQARINQIKIQQAETAALIPRPEPEAVKVADLSGEPVAVDTGVPSGIPSAAAASPAPAVQTPAGQTVTSPTPEAEKVAELTPTPAKIETPESKDRIVAAKLRKPVGASYPNIAIDNNILVNVTVDVTYDIDESGRVRNAALKSIDYKDRYSSRFARSAVAAVKKQRFEPKTVNGRPVYVKDAVKRVVFRGQ